MQRAKMKVGFSFSGLLLAAMLMFSGNALAQDNPYLLLEEVASKTFDRIKNSQDKIKENPDELKAIVAEELLPHIDYQFAALKVLGKYFRKVPKKRIPEYIEVFRTYLISTYAIALGQYEDQTVEFEPPKDFHKRKDVTVRAIIKDGERPDIKIAFKVRRNSKTNEWKAYDMVAEGISLLSSKRSELEGILRQDGIDKVIEELSKKNKQSINLEKAAKG